MRNPGKTAAGLAMTLVIAALASAEAAAASAGGPGRLEDQWCQGTVSGGYSGVITSCGLAAEMLGGTVTYTFTFKVTYANGERYEGGMQGISQSLGEPATGRLTHTAFEMGTSAAINIPTPSRTDACQMLYGEQSGLNWGGYSITIASVPEADGVDGFASYHWFGGSISMDLPPLPGHPGDPCPGLKVEARFRPAR